MKKKLAAFLLLASVLCALPSYAENYVGTFPVVRVLLTNSYQADHGANHLAIAQADMHYVKQPFIAVYNKHMSFSYAYVAPIPMDSCPISNIMTCCNDSCGTCANTISGGHHKNMYKNFFKIKNDISSSGYDHILTLACGNFCNIHSHPSTPHYAYGLGDFDGKYALCKQNSAITQIVRVRTVQHELSHNYGCSDHSPGDTTACIMNGSYDSAPLTTVDIWCSNCKDDFIAPIYPSR